MANLDLTVGPSAEGTRKLAIISTGGHPQRPNSGECVVLAVERVDGWGKRKIDDWFERMKVEQPWATRQ